MLEKPELPKVSVVIPTRDRAHLLPQAIQSVLQQDFSDFELLVMDDGSADETPQVVQAIGDERVQYFRLDGGGRSRARNRGAQLSRAPFVLFLDDDDQLLPSAIADLLAGIESQGCAEAAFGGFAIVDEEGVTLGEHRPLPGDRDPNVPLTWLVDCPAIPSATLLRRERVLEVGGFDPITEISEDRDLFLRLVQAGCCYATVERIVVRYRVHKGSSIKEVMKSKQGHLKVLDKFFSSHSIPDALLAQKNEIYAAGYLDGACAEVAIGDDAAAIEDLKRAWELAPQMFAGRGEPAWDIIVGSCQNLIYHQAPADALRRVATVLPPEARQMRQSLRWVMGRLYLSQYFEAFRQRKWKQVRGSFWRWLPYIPSALLNRGVLSIWLRSWLSPLIARCLEKRMTS